MHNSTMRGAALYYMSAVICGSFAVDHILESPIKFLFSITDDITQTVILFTCFEKKKIQLSMDNY